jgi:hypothetical protein
LIVYRQLTVSGRRAGLGEMPDRTAGSHRSRRFRGFRGNLERTEELVEEPQGLFWSNGKARVFTNVLALLFKNGALSTMFRPDGSSSIGTPSMATTGIGGLFMKRSLPLVVLPFALAILGTAGSCYAQATNVAGYWSGTTRAMPPCDFSAGRCNAVNKVTFSLRQNGKHLKGKYTCAYGNMICRNGGADDSGKVVSGKVSGNQIRLSVVIPADVSNCYYNGMLTSPTTIHGGYQCYNGGELVEEGIWDVTQAAAQ